MNEYIHHVPGRLRIRSPHIRDHAALEATITTALAGLPGILAWRVNPLAGSIVVQYEPQAVTMDALLEACRTHGLLGAPPAGRKHNPPLADGKRFGKAILDLFVHQTVERSVFSMVTSIIKQER
ncbi:MAG: heavy-metal-associated domain-containing protein [Magnetococcales bacterium]|nr:heavy-metal-associated domain-containing protein [Magnetococcales bacterium]